MTTSFCKKCKMIYELSNDVKFIVKSQTGGKKGKDKPSEPEEIKISIKKIIKKLLKGELEKSDNYEYVNIGDIYAHPAFKELPTEDKVLLTSKLPLYIPEQPKKIYKHSDTAKYDADKAYYVCTNCKFYEPIKPQTLLFSQNIHAKNIQ